MRVSKTWSICLSSPLLAAALAFAPVACGSTVNDDTGNDGEDTEGDGEDLGLVSGGKADGKTLVERRVTLKPRLASGRESSRTYSLVADTAFRVSLTYDGENRTAIRVRNKITGTEVSSEPGVQPTLQVDSPGLEHGFRVSLLNHGTENVAATLRVVAVEQGGSDRTQVIDLPHVSLGTTDGRSEFLTVNVPEGALSFAVYVLGYQPRHYYLVDQVEDPNGELLLSEAPPGVTITAAQREACPVDVGQLFSPNRSHAQSGHASLLVPNNPELSVSPGSWRVRVRGVAFSDTGAVEPSTDKPDVKVVIKKGVGSSSSIPERGKVKLHLHLTGSHGLSASTVESDAAFQAALADLKGVYSSVGIDVAIAGMTDIDPRFQEINEADFSRDFFKTLGLRGERDQVNVVVVDKFWYSDGSLFPGYSTGTPGPMLVSDVGYNAVFVSNVPPDPMVPSTPWGLAIAHEVGHYLGLPHTFDDLDSCGVVGDPFDDTSTEPHSGNLMTSGGVDLSRTTTPIHLSPKQAKVLFNSPGVILGE